MISRLTYLTQIVDKDSARLNLRNEKVIPLAADHFSICKFRAASQEKYRLVEGVIIQLVQSVTAHLEPVRCKSTISRLVARFYTDLLQGLIAKWSVVVILTTETQKLPKIGFPYEFRTRVVGFCKISYIRIGFHIVYSISCGFLDTLGVVKA